MRNLLRGAGGSLRQLAHLLRHHGEAAAVLAGSGGLDRGVQRQQVGLPREPGDRFDEAVNLL